MRAAFDLFRISAPSGADANLAAPIAARAKEDFTARINIVKVLWEESTKE
jgi:hypothetical protein